MRTFRTALTVLVAAAVLVTCTDYAAFAATGKSLILGRVNKASKPTTVARTTSGPALQLLTTSSAAPPLAVNGRGKVANLNADSLDGYDASALRSSTYVFTKAVPTPQTYIDQPVTLPPGTYQVGYSAYLYGGGKDGQIAACYLSYNGTLNLAENRFATQTGQAVGLTGTGIVTISAGDDLRLECSAPNSWTTRSDQPIQVYATRTNVVGSGALRTAP